MASLVPTRRLSSVDLPALGRPTKRDEAGFHDASRLRRSASVVPCLGLAAGELPADPHLVDPPPLGLEHLDAQPVDVEALADGRHAAEVRQQVAADGLEPFALDLRRSSRCATSSMFTLPLNTKRPLPSSTIGSDSTSYSSRISPTISSSRSSIVTRPAVPPYSSTTIAHLRLLALELLQQLGHALGLRARRPPAAAAA